MYVISTCFGYFSTGRGQLAVAATGQDPAFGFDRTGAFAHVFETESDALKVLRSLFQVFPSHVLAAKIEKR
jgi:hypothetical protein